MAASEHRPTEAAPPPAEAAGATAASGGGVAPTAASGGGVAPTAASGGGVAPTVLVASDVGPAGPLDGSVSELTPRTRTVVLGLAVCLLAGGATAMAWRAMLAPTPFDLNRMCGTLTSLVTALERGAPTDTQTVNHLARRLTAEAQAAGDATLPTAAFDVRRAISQPAWERSDLRTATRPIAVACGWTWPVTRTPPAVPPRPPRA
jgi:hypothetical protein